jgi:hypothetical protein
LVVKSWSAASPAPLCGALRSTIESAGRIGYAIIATSRRSLVATSLETCRFRKDRHCRVFCACARNEQPRKRVRMSSQAVRLLMLASLCTAATVAAAAGRKCEEPVRWPVERGVENTIRTVPARVSRRRRGRQRSHGGRRHYRRQRPFRTRLAERIGAGHGLHGLELRRRIGALVRQFRRRNLARAYGKR